jgi:hypothetical protein
MIKLRTRPHVFEAIQFQPNQQPWPEAIFTSYGSAWVNTSTGATVIRAGDWLLTDPKGGHYVLSQCLVAEFFEVVTDGAQPAERVEAGIAGDILPPSWK